MTQACEQHMNVDVGPCAGQKPTPAGLIEKGVIFRGSRVTTTILYGSLLPLLPLLPSLGRSEWIVQDCKNLS